MHSTVDDACIWLSKAIDFEVLTIISPYKICRYCSTAHTLLYCSASYQSSYHNQVVVDRIVQMTSQMQRLKLLMLMFMHANVMNKGIYLSAWPV